jgi:hypothetical protein
MEQSEEGGISRLGVHRLIHYIRCSIKAFNQYPIVRMDKRSGEKKNVDLIDIPLR